MLPWCCLKKRTFVYCLATKQQKLITKFFKSHYSKDVLIIYSALKAITN